MIETLGEAYDAGWGIWIACAWGRREGLKSVRDCPARVEADLPTLLWTRGRDMPLSMLSERMRCPRCGSRRVRLQFVPPSGSGLATKRVG